MRLKVAAILLVVVVALYIVLTSAGFAVFAALMSWNSGSSFMDQWVLFWHQLWWQTLILWLVMYVVAVKITIKQIEAKNG